MANASLVGAAGDGRDHPVGRRPLRCARAVAGKVFSSPLPRRAWWRTRRGAWGPQARRSRLVARLAERLDRPLRYEILATGGDAQPSTRPTSRSRPRCVRSPPPRARRHGHVDFLPSRTARALDPPVDHRTPRSLPRQRALRSRSLPRTTAVLVLALLPSIGRAQRGHIVNIRHVGVSRRRSEWRAYPRRRPRSKRWLRAVARGDPRPTAPHYLDPLRTSVRTRCLAARRPWRRVPAMIAEEAAAIGRPAIVQSPRTIMPWCARPPRR